MAASRGQLHQHEQQVGREQAGAARGQHGASGLRAGVAGSAGRTACRACLAAFLPSGALAEAAEGGRPRRRSADGRGLRAERAVMNREGGRWGAGVCSARGSRSAGPVPAAAGWLPEPGPWEFPL